MIPQIYNRRTNVAMEHNVFGLREVKYPFRAWDAHKYKNKVK